MNKGAVREIRGEKMYEADLLKYLSSTLQIQLTILEKYCMNN